MDELDTEISDPEFKTWSPDAQYLFQERLGILCKADPFSKCNEEAVELAREQARMFEIRRKRAEKKNQ